jgi:hypothetical protein
VLVPRETKRVDVGLVALRTSKSGAPAPARQPCEDVALLLEGV